MKTNVLIMLLFFAAGLQAQTHRFIYEVDYRRDSTSDYLTKQVYHLDISGKKSMYYIRDYFVADSLLQHNLPFPEAGQLSTSNIIEHTLGTDEFSEYDLLQSLVLKLSGTDRQEWQLTGSSKQENGLQLQEARTAWGGRNWTAWFTADIPFQEGPHKFHGLPGLITRLEDSEGHYTFSLIKSENRKSTYQHIHIAAMKAKSVATDRRQYEKTKQTYYDSPVSFLRSMKRNSGADFFLNDGTVVSQNNTREINERLRKEVHTFNNPIERNRAISYKE